MPQLSAETLKSKAANARQMATAFGQILTVFLKSPTHRQLSLAAIETLVAPAIRSAQFVVAEAQVSTTGLTSPIAVVLWAEVSKAVDIRLSEDIANTLTLKPKEWTSGEQPWIIDAVGEPKVLAMIFNRLLDSKFQGRVLKARARSPDGDVIVRELTLTEETKQ